MGSCPAGGLAWRGPAAAGLESAGWPIWVRTAPPAISLLGVSEGSPGSCADSTVRGKGLIDSVAHLIAQFGVDRSTWVRPGAERGMESEKSCDNLMHCGTVVVR